MALEGEEELELDRPVRALPQVYREAGAGDEGHRRPRPAEKVVPLDGGFVLLDEGLKVSGSLFQRRVDQPFQVFDLVHGRRS